MSVTKDMKKHVIWATTVLVIILIVCFTVIYLQAHEWIIRFEMDDNTLEAIKSLNWTAVGEANG